jgi:hypothetical protein
MSELQKRLSQAAAAYRERARDGGWGASAGDPPSAVHTTEVLAVLRAARVPYGSAVVRTALNYLAGVPPLEPSPSGVEHSDAGRDASETPTADYAWALCGLTMFVASRQDPRLRRAQQGCIEWLKTHEWNGQGAWSERPEDEHPSLLSTSAAITGLGRIGNYHPNGADARSLVTRARAVVHKIATVPPSPLRSQRIAWWGLKAEASHGSASATAMAVLSLAGGNLEDRRLAAQGARWLLRHRDLWQCAIEDDAAAPEPGRRHMTFSLALRAVLRGLRLPSDDLTLRPTVGYLETLWWPEHREWRNGTPHAHTSTSGSYAAAMAYDALARSWRFDPDRDILGASRRGTRNPPRTEQFVYIGPERTVRVRNFDGEELEMTLPTRVHKMFEELATQHIRGAGSKNPNASSCDLLDLARRHRVEQETVLRYCRIANNTLRSEATEQRQWHDCLLQVIRPSGNPRRRRATIDVDKVMFDSREGY